MFSLLVARALLQDLSRTGRVLFAIALGAAVATGVLAVFIGIDDQVQQELRSYGANIEIAPASHMGSHHVAFGGVEYRLDNPTATIPVARLASLKSIFWKNNILAFAPFLKATYEVNGTPTPVVGTWFHHPVNLPEGGQLTTGALAVDRWWTVDGHWPSESRYDECVVGADLARQWSIRPGAALPIEVNGTVQKLKVVGILNAGGDEDGEVVAPLTALQQWTGQNGRALRVEVSALVKPDDALSHRDPAKLTDADREKLICSPYMGEILSEIQSVIPGAVARPVYRVADSAGRLLNRIRMLMGFVLISALAASLLGAGSAAAASALQRRREIALVRAIGAPIGALRSQHVAETALLGLAAGLVGAPCGLGLYLWIRQFIFHGAGAIPWIVIPVGLALALVISVAAGSLPLMQAAALDPAAVLSEES